MDDAASLTAGSVAASQPRAGAVTKKTLLLTCAACIVAGYLIATVPGFTPINPFKPKDRPIARLFSRLAKFGLWVAVFAENRPEPNMQYARACVNGDAVCHAEGW